MYGERLKELRESKEINRKEMAEILNIDQSTYGKYELEKNEPSFEMLKKIATFFEVSTDYIIGMTNIKTIIKNEVSTIPYKEIKITGYGIEIKTYKE